MARVLFLDLDDFKVVNDTLGHAAGDRLLAAVAERIESASAATTWRPGSAATSSRSCWRTRMGSPGHAVAKRIIEALQVPFPVPGQEIVVGASIGIAVARDISEHADELLRNADVAMYTAKAGGKRRVAVFDPTMHAAIVARHALSAELGPEHRPRRAAGLLPADRRAGTGRIGASRRSSAGATRPAA